jgi:predicted ester cyclase
MNRIPAGSTSAFGRRAALGQTAAALAALGVAARGLDASAQDATPSAGDAKAVVNRLYEEVFNQKRMDVLDGVFAGDLVDHTGGPQGGAGAKGSVVAILTAIPDLHVTPGPWVVQGDLVATLVSFTGTLHGDFLGVAATGQPVAWSHIDIHRVRDGQIAEIWHPGLVTALQLALGYQIVPPTGAALATPTA